jgi:hypothetical protein
MTQLETIEIHSKTASIEENAFEQCIALREIFIFDMYIFRDGNLSLHGAMINKLGPQCFRNTLIKYAYIPSSVESIHRSVFKGCEFLQVIIVDLPCSKWENPDLEYAHVLQILTIRSFESLKNQILDFSGINFRQITPAEFEGSDLIEVILPDSVKQIYQLAFAQCSQLKKVAIGGQLLETSSNMFEECKVLSEIKIGAKLY